MKHRAWLAPMGLCLLSLHTMGNPVLPAYPGKDSLLAIQLFQPTRITIPSAAFTQNLPDASREADNRQPVAIADSFSASTYPVEGARYLQFRMEKNFSMAITQREDIRQVHQASPFTGVHGRIAWQLPANSIYASLYRKPVLGLGMMISTFSNPSVGNPVGVYGFLQVPLVARPGRFQLLYEIALGAVGNLNPYDEVKNPENLLVGSAVNALVELGLEGRYILSKQWELGLGVGVKHISNGATKRPNKGVNIIPVQLNVQYRLAEANSPRRLMHQYSFRPFVALEVSNMSGFKQMRPGDAMTFKNISSVQAAYQFSYKYRLGLGMDLTYSSGGTTRVADGSSAFAQQFSFGISGTWSWFITEKLYLPISVGLYTHRNPENDETTPYYQRVGLRYLFPKRHLSAGLGLKFHAGVADFIEAGIGWTFHRDRNQYRVEKD